MMSTRADVVTPSSKTLVREPGPAELGAAKFRTRRRRVERGLSLCVPVLLFVAWEFAARGRLIDPTFFPPPSAIWEATVDAVDSGVLQDAVVVSIRKVLIGYAIGIGSGLMVGFGLGMSRLVRAALEPLLVAFYVVPKLALLPVLLLIFGLSETPQIILIALTVFFLVAIPTIATVKEIAPGYVEAALSFDATRWQLFRHVVLPASMPAISTALRLSAGMAVLVMVGVELLMGGRGLGYLIWNSWQIFLPALMYAGIVVVSVLGVAFTAVVTAIMQRLVPWADKEWL